MGSRRSGTETADSEIRAWLALLLDHGLAVLGCVMILAAAKLLGILPDE